MITIDGAQGEGGGQVLRSALGLSIVSGRPFTIKNIRAKRKKPGLMRQHLTAVRAAAEVCGGTVERDAIGSQELRFTPGPARGGDYRFPIGTAGSCTLVFQTILPALLLADGPSTVRIEGGTHNPWAPPFDFLQQSFLPLLGRMGAEVNVELIRPGFFPAGGGCMEFTVQPAKLKELQLVEFSKPELSAQALCASLPQHIARRELETIGLKLGITEQERLKAISMDSPGPGNAVSIFARSPQLCETFTGFGEKNVSAEKVAVRVIKEVRDYLLTAAPVGPYLADQLLIPLALAGGGRFRTGAPSGHTRTNIAVIERFLEIRFSVVEVEGCWEIGVNLQQPPESSPFDVPGLKTAATTEDILQAIQDSRSGQLGDKPEDKSQSTPQS